VILYQMLTGELPFSGDNYNTLLIKVLTEEARPPREINPGIPVEVEALVLRELSKEASSRSQSAAALLGELKRLAAFAERERGMTMLATRLKSVVARGDLGGTRGGGGQQSSASDILSQMAGATPAHWAGTQARPRRGRYVLGGVAAIVLSAGIAAFFVLGGQRGEPEQAAVPVPLVPAPAAEPGAAAPEPESPAVADGVLIEVVGAPEGARILYDGVPVPENPFPVERKGTMVKIEVLADGFEPLITSVIPSEDRRVEAALRPESKAITRTPRARPAKGAAAAKGEQPPVPAGGKGADLDVKEGKRGTKFGGDFH